MDRIASKGVRFSNSFCNINSTDPSVTSICTGKHPVSHGLRNHGHNVTAEEKSYTANVKLLAEVLQENGYLTIGLDWLGKWHKRGYDIYGDENITDAMNLCGERSGAGLPKDTPSNPSGRSAGKGFRLPGRGDWYYRLPDFARSAVRSMSRRWNVKTKGGFSRKRRPALSDSAGLADLAIQHIRQIKDKKNFMMFIHFWDTHTPYTAPHAMVKSFHRKYDYSREKVSSVLKMFRRTASARLIHKSVRGKTPKTVGEIMAYYDASIRYVDGNIGRIYNTLDELNLLDDTLLIITADHGESMDEHQIYFNHHGLYEPQVKVPLILSHEAYRPAQMPFHQYRDFLTEKTVLSIRIRRVHIPHPVERLHRAADHRH